MKITTLLIVIPVVTAAGIIAVANTGEVLFSLDPFSAEGPSLSLTLPLFMLVFLSFFMGVVVGGITALLRRGRSNQSRLTSPVAVQK